MGTLTKEKERHEKYIEGYMGRKINNISCRRKVICYPRIGDSREFTPYHLNHVKKIQDKRQKNDSG